MAWVNVLRRYPYTPSKNRRVCEVYLPGVQSVPREAAKKAIAAGAAVAVPTPSREEAQALGLKQPRPVRGGRPVK